MREMSLKLLSTARIEDETQFSLYKISPITNRNKTFFKALDNTPPVRNAQ